MVVVLANLKPRNMRKVKSVGMVMAASNEDHTSVEPIAPPAGAAPGERIFFSGTEQQVCVCASVCTIVYYQYCANTVYLYGLTMLFLRPYDTVFDHTLPSPYCMYGLKVLIRHVCTTLV